MAEAAPTKPKGDDKAKKEKSKGGEDKAKEKPKSEDKGKEKVEKAPKPEGEKKEKAPKPEKAEGEKKEKPAKAPKPEKAEGDKKPAKPEKAVGDKKPAKPAAGEKAEKAEKPKTEAKKDKPKGAAGEGKDKAKEKPKAKPAAAPKEGGEKAKAKAEGGKKKGAKKKKVRSKPKKKVRKEAPVSGKPAFAAARPVVPVGKFDLKGGVSWNVQVRMPAVLLTSIRQDIVHDVHTSMAKNRRQPYAVSENAGHQHSAESWGTGRAVARIPRVSGGGTSRAGQGAFGNMCRSGRMFAPTKTWRKWHRKINLGQKRYAVCSALAASAIPALVMGRGHAIDRVPQVPLVIDDGCQSLRKTKEAVALLKAVGADGDVLRAANSRKLRAGKGKLRNRRHVIRRGPLIVFAQDRGICRAFRNLPGVDLCQVDRLNLLKLAPGGHLGRFVVWTKAAFNKLDKIFGTFTRDSAQKHGFHLPRPIMTQSDLPRLINSDEIQSVLRGQKSEKRLPRQKKNPLKNFAAMVKLNPYALTLKRNELLAEERRAKERMAVIEAKRKGLAAPAKSPYEAKRQLKVKLAHKKHAKTNKARNYARLTGEGKAVTRPHFTSEFADEQKAKAEEAQEDKTKGKDQKPPKGGPKGGDKKDKDHDGDETMEEDKGKGKDKDKAPKGGDKGKDKQQDKAPKGEKKEKAAAAPKAGEDKDKDKAAAAAAPKGEKKDKAAGAAKAPKGDDKAAKAPKDEKKDKAAAPKGGDDKAAKADKGGDKGDKGAKKEKAPKGDKGAK